VQVFEYQGPFVTDFCQLLGKAVVASGTANFHAPFLFTPGGALSAAAVVRGTVDLVSGGQARLFGRAHTVVRADGSLVFDHEVVTLTPL
jgi:hypothetical protein